MLTCALMKRLALALVCSSLLACGGGVSPNPDGGSGGGGGFSDGGLDLNDVSFLFPLPATGRESQLLGMSGLFPKRLYDGVELILQGADKDALYGDLRVVSARVDPCFPGSAPPEPPKCVKQLRLVAQPVRNGGADAGYVTVAEDATIHLFYELSDADFTATHRALWELKAMAGSATDGKPLDVHPVMKAQGLDGAYAKKVNELITARCSEQHLTRVAFMSVATFGAAWRFGAFDVVNGALVADPIPRINGATVQGVQEQGNTSFRAGVLLPSVAGDDLDVLLSESAMRLTDERTLKRALTSALRIEHPDRSSPKTIDCASCHVASRARRNAEQRRMVDNSQHPDAFHANPRFNLTRVDAVGDDPRALRAFGYLGRDSALSQRTINESAAVAETLSQSRP